MRVTIRDIAAKAGVSKTTVSFVLNDPGRISPETRKRVLDIIAEMGYEPDSVARALATRRLGAIGLLLPQPLHEALSNPHLCEIVRGIGMICDERGLVLTMLPPIRGKVEEAARRAAVDSLIMIGIEVDTEVTRILGRRHLPFVTIDAREMEGIANIGIDNEAAAQAMMEHVLALGHRRVGILRLKPEAYSSGAEGHSLVSERRLSGFAKALAKFNLVAGGTDAAIVLAEGSFEGGLRATDELLALPGPMPTAFVAMADIIALGAYDALRRRGLSVPSDASVSGFDDIPLASRASPPLSTVRQPGFEKGAGAATLACELLSRVDSRSRILPFELVIRASTGAPGQSRKPDPAQDPAAAAPR